MLLAITIMIDRLFDFSSLSTLPSTSSYNSPVTDSERINMLDLHVRTNDYFRYLTTLLGFVEETLDSGECSRESLNIQLEAVRATRKDLQYLNDHYYIEPR